MTYLPPLPGGSVSAVNLRTNESLPGGDHGTHVLMEVVAVRGRERHVHNLAFVLPSGNGAPIDFAVFIRAQNYPPPAPSETDWARRARLVGEVLDRARQSGQLGLTTDNQDNTVTALLDALDGEFADEGMSVLNPNDDDPKDD